MAELKKKPPHHVTDFLRPGSVTNPRELYTLVRQILEGHAGRNIRAGSGNHRIELTIRGQRMEAWVGPASDGTLKFNSIYPKSSSPGLTKAQIATYKTELETGVKTLQQIRNELKAQFQ